jgi:hypothetical protein
MLSRPGHKLKITLLVVADVVSNGSAELRMLFDNLENQLLAHGSWLLASANCGGAEKSGQATWVIERSQGRCHTGICRMA